MTTPKQSWPRVTELFEQALDHAPEDRAEFLQSVCADDSDLLHEVESLLAEHDAQASFLEQPAVASLEDATQLFTSSSPRGLPEQIGPYKVVRSLGAGGMGEVYLTHDERLNRPVAVKLLSVYHLAEGERIHRFRREALAASKLNHPNILTIYEIGEADGKNFIASEFVDGQTLLELIKSGPVSISTAVELAIQITGALSVAHAAGIIHRDIKPANIMIRPDGLVKVLDFGIAKYDEAPGSRSADDSQLETAAGTVIGTAAYMSPEQARGLPLDPRTDLWSAGAILYELITGVRAFQGETMLDIMAAVIEKTPRPFSAYGVKEPQLERIVFTALHKDRQRRYQTADELLAELKQCARSLGASDGQGETSTPRPHPQETVSIAVMPFVNMSADPENEYFCDGLSEELLNALTRVEDLKVAARTSAFSFKGKNATASGIARALNVTSILEGSVRKSGNKLRITVQLVNAADGYHVWSERYDRELQDIFDVQDEITLSVVDALKLRLLKSEKDAVLKRHTENVEAYQLYLKGRYFWWKSTPEDFHKSREFFQRAVEADPNYALGYCGLSSYYGFGSAWGFVPPELGWPKAIEANRRATALDDSLAEVHNDLAGISMVFYRDAAATEREARRAVELNPKFQEIHYLYSNYLLIKGQVDAAIGEAQRAVELDPLSVRVSNNLGYCYFLARRYDEAVAQFEQALELDENNPMVHEWIAEALEQKGHFAEAIKHCCKALELTGEADAASLVQRLFDGRDFAAAMRGLAEKRLGQLNTALAAGDYIPAIKFARIYARLGDVEQAFDWLEKACAERNVFALIIHADPIYDPLRPDPRFAALLSRFKLTGQEATPLKHAERWGSDSGGKGFQTENTLAVLPFKPLVPDHRDAALELGMADTLITKLSGREIIVRPISSVRKFVDLDQDPIAAGKQLQVASVLDGTIQRSGDRIRMTVRLISAANGESVWSGTFDEKFTDIFAVQDAISEKIMSALSVTISSETNPKIKRPTENTEAYELYLRGRYHVSKLTPADVQTSVSYFQQAIAIDPSYALAYVGLSNSYRAFSLSGDQPIEFLPKSKQAAQKAVALDPSLAEAHAVLGFTIFWYDWDWQAAEHEFKRALELDPNSADARWFYGTLLSSQGRFTEALNEARRAREIDPLNLVLGGAEAQFLINAGRPDEALARLQKTIELDANFWFAHVWAASAYIEKGMLAEAVAEAHKAKEFSGSTFANAFLGYALAKAGRKTEAEKELQDLFELSKQRYIPPYHIALIYNGLSMRDEALGWLQRGYEQRDPKMVFLRVEPKWNNLRNDARFQSLLKRIGLPRDENKTVDAVVKVAQPATSQAENQTRQSIQNAMTKPVKSARNRYLILAGLIPLMILILGVVLWTYLNRRPQISTIAVMPFKNESGNTDVEYLSDGMTDSLITSLSQLPQLSVKARSSVFRYKDKELPSQQLGNELDVQAILVGSLKQRGNDLKLHLELVDTKTETALWSNDYNRSMTSLVTLQSEIARDVSRQLRARLSVPDEQRVTRNYTENTEAYQLYLNGRYHYFRLTRPEIDKSIALYQEAIALDQSYALAYTGLSASYRSLALTSDVPAIETLPKAKKAASRAVEIDEALADAHAELGFIGFWFDWDWKESERQFLRAIELNPNNEMAHMGYAQLLSSMNRHDQALSEAKRGQTLEPGGIL